MLRRYQKSSRDNTLLTVCFNMRERYQGEDFDLRHRRKSHPKAVPTCVIGAGRIRRSFRFASSAQVRYGKDYSLRQRGRQLLRTDSGLRQ
jgi:hypothetical protein